MLSTLLEKTDPARRRVGTAIVVGVIGGFFSAIVKFGWEVPFPPRTPERNATNPPQQLLEQLGMSPEQSHTGVTFNGNEGLPIYSFIIHFSFAIVFAVFYCVMAEYYKSITLWQGAAFGLLVWVGAHLVLGHVIWLWSIELVRRDVRNRITHQPDPWVPLDAEPAR